MGFNQAINIAIFGLSLRTLNELKEKIQAAIPDFQINWQNIAEPQLDILLINHNFYDSPNIRNLIHNNNIDVLQIKTNHERNSLIEDGTLYLPLNHLHSLHQWLSQHIQNRFNQNMVPAPEPTLLHNKKQIREILQEIFNPNNGKIQLFDHHGILAIADPRNQWVWQHPDLAAVETNHSLNYTYATHSDQTWIHPTIQQDLKQWFWNLLWASPDFNELCPRSASSFYLEVWPQPKYKADRQDILRMSACFAQGAHISTVATQLHLPEQKVKRFVAACLGANCGKLIKDQQAHYRPQKNAPTETEQHFMKKLFGRLRNRLGF